MGLADIMTGDDKDEFEPSFNLDHKTCWISEDSIVTDSIFGKFVEIAERSKISESFIDDYSYVMNDCEVIYSRIGKFCSIASHVRINPGNHPMQRVGTHHFTYRSRRYGFADDDPSFFDWRRANEVVIGHDVWIGHGAVILPGVSLGTGSVVGAGSIVTKDVDEYSIVAGNPATLIRKRFPDEICSGLKKLSWWEWEYQRLKYAINDFRHMTPSDFINKYGSGDTGFGY